MDFKMVGSEIVKLGVFGGSFDPPHLSHVAVCSFALALTDIQKILIVPCYQHAHSKSLLSFDQRLQMCELAFSDLRRTEVSDLESELGGTSYTLRTLEHLEGALPEAQLALIMGADTLRDRDTWFQFDKIEAKAEFVVFPRAGVSSSPSLANQLPGPPEISSTEIRSRVRRGLDVEGLVPRAVLRYINDHGLYSNR